MRRALPLVAAVGALLSAALVVPGLPSGVSIPLALFSLVLAPGLVGATLAGQEDPLMWVALVVAVGVMMNIVTSLPLYYLDAWTPGLAVALVAVPTLLGAVWLELRWRVA